MTFIILELYTNIGKKSTIILYLNYKIDYDRHAHLF